jgi:hypothetical protein
MTKVQCVQVYLGAIAPVCDERRFSAHPSAAKAAIHLVPFSARLKPCPFKTDPFLQHVELRAKQAEEKIRTNSEFSMAGAEARLILLILLARLKPCPYYKASSVEFSAAFEARLILLILLARLKPCPYYKATSIEFFRSL